MIDFHRKVELLAPAGNFEKMEVAIHFGADAVYLGGKQFSLRHQADNFDLDALARAVDLAHRSHTRVYVACNVYSRNSDQDALFTYLRRLSTIGPDGIIAADPAVVTTALREAPGIPVHISTQANTTNHVTAGFWKSVGASRINAARELSLEELRVMVQKSGIEVEVFVHGAMCIAYSGRCLISSFLSGRDGNRGHCAQSCRWRYALVEEKRPGHYHPIAEDAHGTYFFNSKDLCMIEHIPELIESGVASLKIEGRMKGLTYLAAVVKSYRAAIDAYYRSPTRYIVEPQWLADLNAVARRGHCTGFFFGRPEETVPDYRQCIRSEKRRLVGKIVEKIGTDRYRIDVKNGFHSGESLDALSAHGSAESAIVADLVDAEQFPTDRAVSGTFVVATLPGLRLERLDLLTRAAPERPPPEKQSCNLNR
jgi:putative protease